MFTYYADPARTLFIDVDASKEFGIGAMIYHVKGDPAPIFEKIEACLRKDKVLENFVDLTS